MIAPLSNVLDAFSLLSVPQLIALTVTLIAYYSLWRWRRARSRGTTRWSEFCAASRVFVVYLLLVAMSAVLPRPMAALRVTDPDAVIFDVHSHTNYSHDASHTFTVQANRDWHRDAGFDVAYITDHRCFDGAAEGLRGNPKRAGDGTVLLSGVELQGDEQHQVVLEPPDAMVPKGFLETWCVRAGAGRVPARPPVRVQTIPEDLSKMRVASPAMPNGVTAIEISDGAPRGLAQGDRDDKKLWDLASVNHLTRGRRFEQSRLGTHRGRLECRAHPGMAVDESRFARSSDRGSAPVPAGECRAGGRAAPIRFTGAIRYLAIAAYAFMPLIFTAMVLPSRPWPSGSHGSRGSRRSCSSRSSRAAAGHA